MPSSQTIVGGQLVQVRNAMASGRFQLATFRLQGTENTVTPARPIVRKSLFQRPVILNIYTEGSIQLYVIVNLQYITVIIFVEIICISSAGFQQ